MSYRKIEYLNNRRIIYNRDPINDEPTETYDWGKYFEQGTYECYELFKSKAKISSFKSLKWHLLVLKYLNPTLSEKKFKNLAYFISSKCNGFITFDIKEKFVVDMLKDMYKVEERSPVNRKRKIIFKPRAGLSTSDKLKIVGQFVGRARSITSEDIYQTMLFINDTNEIITWNKVARLLNCSTRTVQRYLTIELKQEKHILNNEKI